MPTNMHILLSLALFLFCGTTLILVSSHPYDPHDHTSTPFFEGWFVRITSSSTSGPSSLAFGIGHLPDQHPSNPSAACFLIMPADRPVSATPQTSSAATTATVTSPYHQPRPDHHRASSSSIKTESYASTAKVKPNAEPRTFTHYFSSLDVHPSKEPILCLDCPAFVAVGSNAGGSCRLEVSGNLVSIQAEVPGSFKFAASNNPDSATIIPWGDNPGSSPEGWLPAGMLKLHWYVYSMATPMTYNLTLFDLEDGSMSDAATAQAQHDMQQAGQEEQEQQPQEQLPGPVHLASVKYSGTGFAHMEKNWGDGFPEQWVWAQGVSSDGTASFVLAGGSLPIKSPSLHNILSAFLTKQSLFNFPSIVRPRTAHSASTAQNLHSCNQQPALHQSSHHSRDPRTTATTEGSTVHVHQQSEPLALAFSLHTPTLNLTVDPFNPGWVTSFEPCGCCASLAVTIASWSHQIVIRLEADQDSFAALPCPTEDGFRVKTDESFVATAHVRVYGSAVTDKQPTKQSRHEGGSFDRHRDTGQNKKRLLLSSAVFEGAALEFGGSLRCASAKRTMDSTADGSAYATIAGFVAV